MDLGPFRQVMAIKSARQLLLISFVGRLPYSTTGLILTLHVVQHLGLSYASAGLVTAASTLGFAIGAPWRGRLIDQVGLRRALVASIVAEVFLYSIAAFVEFGPLLLVAFLSGVFMVPVFTIMRQSLSVTVPITLRRAAFSADGIAAELSFVVGPAVGIWAATTFGTQPMLIFLGIASSAVGMMLWVLNIATRSEEHLDSKESSPGKWLNTSLIFVFVLAGTTTFALHGTDLALFAHLREMGSLSQLGIVFATWSGGSIIGGLIYGAMPRSVRPSHLILALALLTIPIGLAQNTWQLALAVIPAGMLTSPAITAVGEWVAHLVPEDRRGEAMGWQGTAFTLGGAFAAPIVGATMDNVGPWGGYALAGIVSAVIAIAALGLQSTMRKSAKHLHP